MGLSACPASCLRHAEHHVRPNVFYYSPRAHKERQEVKARREEGQKYYTRAKVRSRAYVELLQHSAHQFANTMAWYSSLGTGGQPAQGRRALPTFLWAAHRGRVPSWRLCVLVQAALNDKSDVEAAEKLLELAVSSWPDNAKFLLALADCVAYKRKDPERALQWYVAHLKYAHLAYAGSL